MRVVIQRVSEAAVKVGTQITGAITTGLLVLAGFEDTDTQEDFEWMSKKIVSLRIFNDSNGVMNLSCTDINGEILLVSQFTLHASTQKGNRPSYIKAAKPDIARKMYEDFALILGRHHNKPLQTGIFGADMKVSLLNDGPVTIMIDSKNKE
jgi:D-tyrosyl-tRNA(Tyr) deacylase